MRNFAAYRIMICALLPFVVVDCQSISATNCAGLCKNEISPAGLVALIKTYLVGAERVEGNDEDGKTGLLEVTEVGR